MDDAQPKAKPISDDQELAKVLAGVTQETKDLDFEQTPIISPATPAVTSEPAPAADEKEPATTPTPEPVVADTPTANSGDLEGIKKDALTELRPLVDKLELEPDEKFDIYLLLLRSTDDKTLIAPAHLAAKNIPDESKRAQALLDVIKEIDYLSAPVQPTESEPTV